MCYILVDGREAKSFLANEPKTHKKGYQEQLSDLASFSIRKMRRNQLLLISHCGKFSMNTCDNLNCEPFKQLLFPFKD